MNQGHRRLAPSSTRTPGIPDSDPEQAEQGQWEKTLTPHGNRSQHVPSSPGSMMHMDGNEEPLNTSIRADGQSLVEQCSASRLTDDASWNSSDQLLDRFERFGDLVDLQMAITILEGLIGSTLVRDSWYRAGLANLGVALSYRFNRLGDLRDLREAISRHRGAVELTPRADPERPGRLNNLGTALKARFQRLGELSDLHDAILMLREAINLAPDGHPDRLSCFNTLGSSLEARFKRLGELSDLKEAISRHRDCVGLTHRGHPKRPGCLNNLGNALKTRFKRLGEVSDLEEAISILRDAVDLIPRGHPDKPARLQSLGNSYFIRFKRLGQLSDLEQAISILENAVDLTPHGHPGKPARFSNLGNCFKARFQRLGELSDLDNGALMYRLAVDLVPHGHPDQPSHLNNLGNAFKVRFGCLGELSDLGNAISILQDAVNCTPRDHPDNPNRLNNLGSCFLSRFERIGELNDLEHAISMLRDAIARFPHGHSHKPILLNNLGCSFQARFRRLGEPKDIKQSISILKAAVDLTPDDHPQKPAHLGNLGNAFGARFDRFRKLNDLEDAILMLKNAVDLSPHGHPLQPAFLNSLGSSLRARFERLGEPSDLEGAILRHRSANDLTPHNHPSKPSCFNHLGNTFFVRFRHLGELSDLEEAISRYIDAISLTPLGHPHMPGRLHNLALCFDTRFKRLGQSGDLEQAITLYSRVASASTGPITTRFDASRNWILCARHARHHSLFHAHSVAITLLPQLAWIGFSLTRRYRELRYGADVAREAAATALDARLPETAVEWLEQGRSIVWGELHQLRSSYDDLSSAHPEHARRLRELSAALEQAGAAREQSYLAVSEGTPNEVYDATESLQQETDRHRTLAIERDKLLQEIRSLPGFEQFLRYKRFSQLRTSAHAGPVVILNTAENRCDALIVLAGVDHVIHVPLPHFTFKRSADLQMILKNFLRHAHVIRSDDREGQRATLDGISWPTLLATLWRCIVKPILDALAFSIHDDLSRIFWCPTGPLVFLPLHAAGFYDSQYSHPGHKVFDFVISSYVPNLSILTPSLDSSTAPNNNPRLLAIRQPKSDGLSRLPGVVTELEHIKRVIKDSPSACITFLESSVGTVEEVLDLMKESDWVHFACHGIQDAARPTESGLCLANRRRLKVSDMIALSRPHGGFALLSACQTAMGDQALSDEAIHIAAGMLFAGYAGVIGTMWSISDKLAPIVARDIYEQLLQNGRKPDYREAAQALHDAIGRLRECGEVPFNEWIPFIHVGL